VCCHVNFLVNDMFSPLNTLNLKADIFNSRCYGPGLRAILKGRQNARPVETQFRIKKDE